MCMLQRNTGTVKLARAYLSRIEGCVSLCNQLQVYHLSRDCEGAFIVLGAIGAMYQAADSLRDC